MSTFVGKDVIVEMDPAPLVYAHVFHEGSGPARYLGRKADEVAVLARIIAPKRTGKLAASIFVSRNRNERGQYAFGYTVNVGTGYGAYVHEGTGPSLRQTYPKNMRFQGTHGSAGHIVVTDIVRHPGTPAQPFLQDALIAMVG